MVLETPPYRDVATYITMAHGYPRPQGKPGTLTQLWVVWFQKLLRALYDVSWLVGSVALTARDASIVSTPVPTGKSLSTGLYRIGYTARITRAASTSSNLVVTMGWTDGGVSCTASNTSDLSVNTTATQANGALMVHLDAGTTVTYTTTYTSVGATTMTYALYIVMEALP